MSGDPQRVETRFTADRALVCAGRVWLQAAGNETRIFACAAKASRCESSPCKGIRLDA